MAVLGHDAAARRRHRRGAGVGEIGAADIEAALGRPQQAGQHHAELALAVALDAGQPDDLAGTDFQGEVVEPHGAVAVVHREAVAHQGEAPSVHRPSAARRLVGLGAAPRRAGCSSRPTMAWTSAPMSALGHALVGDQPAGAQHGHAIGDLGDLGELVGHQDDGAAGIGDAAADVEQRADLAGRQHGGRLVEHQKLGIAHQALHDLGALALADRELADHRARDRG